MEYGLYEKVRNHSGSDVKFWAMLCYRGSCHNSDRVHKCFNNKDFRNSIKDS